MAEDMALKLFELISVSFSETEECRLLGCDTVWSCIRTNVSEERIVSIIRVKRISELGTLAVTSNRNMLTFLAR
jgi:hypothetical protein